MSDKFSIAETESFTKKINSRLFSHLRKKLDDYVYPILEINPFYGPNIKKLKGEFSDVYRYRIGYFRIFYTIEKEKLIVIFIDVHNRKDAYKKK